MRRLLVAAALAASLTLAACGKDEDKAAPTAEPTAESSGLLQRSDVAGVESEEFSDQPNVSKTNCAAMDAEWNLAVSKDYESVDFVLTDEDSVKSTVQGPPTGSESIDATFDRLEVLVDECSEAELPFGTFERLDGLPDGAIGFVATEETSNGAQRTERGYGRIDDQRAAVVTVIHRGDGEAAVSVTELLPKALDRATAG